MHISLFSEENWNMDNTTVLTFTMTAYTILENYKDSLFAVFLLLYLLTITLNSLLIMTTHLNKELHHPMNIFTCLLSFNEIYGSTALLPLIMSVLLSRMHEIPVKWCIVQVYFLHTYASAEFCILALMAYDRYIAICYPLHYQSIMSYSKICKLVALTVLYPNTVIACYVSLTLQLTFCGKVIPKLYCVNMEVVKNACSDSIYINIVGLLLILILIVPHVVMILISYVEILKVCRKLTRKSQHNALRTCIPHLLSLLNYTIGSMFEIAQTRFDMSHVKAEARIFLSLYFVIIPSIANPVLYGLCANIIRVHFLKLFMRSKILPRKLGKAATAG